MQTAIEPALDSVAGNIEIAIYMATEIEDALKEICGKNDERINDRLTQIRSARQN